MKKVPRFSFCRCVNLPYQAHDIWILTSRAEGETVTHQNPSGPNQPSPAKIAPGTAGIPSEQTSRAQSLRPNVIFLFNTIIKNAEEESLYDVKTEHSQH